MNSQKRGLNSRIKDLSRWIYTKSLTHYERLLLQLALVLESLYPQERTEIKGNNFDKELLEKLPCEKSKSLYLLLTHGLTLLHQKDRLYENHHWQSEREDQLLALLLLQPKYYPSSLIHPISLRIYQQLLESFYPKDFTVYEGMLRLRMPKSTLKWHMNALENADYIERTGGNKKTGYTYNINRSPWK